jgi:hypothetical protein
MKPATAANLSLLLALLALPCCYYGALSQMGDPAPGASAEHLRAARRVSMLVLSTGVAGLFGALWLSGYGWVGARRRAALAAAACVVPVACVLYQLVRWP